MKTFALLALLLAAAVAAPGASAPTRQAAASPAAERTLVRDAAALARLRRNSGITLQWISFEAPARGHVHVTDQRRPRSPARLAIGQWRRAQARRRPALDRSDQLHLPRPDLDRRHARPRPQLPARRHIRVPGDPAPPLLAAAADGGVRRPHRLCRHLFLRPDPAAAVSWRREGRGSGDVSISASVRPAP